jgi:Zn finger protein HypA/HybF involved in hydrogenase expression
MTQTQNEKTEKKCWKCKRILVANEKFPLCPSCREKATQWVPLAVAGVAGLLIKIIPPKDNKNS